MNTLRRLSYGHPERGPSGDSRKDEAEGPPGRTASGLLARLLPEQGGFSVLETILALGILGIIGVAFMSTLDSGTRATGVLDEQVEAAALARSQLEEIKDMPFNEEDCHPECYPVTVGAPLQYEVTVESRSVDQTLDGAVICSAGDDCLHEVTARVSRAGKQVLALTTHKRK